MKPTPPSGSISIRIADCEYYVTCSEGEREGLLRAAQFLDNQIKQVQTTDRSMSVERSAVMVALNLADQLINKNKASVALDDATGRISELSEKIDEVLSKNI